MDINVLLQAVASIGLPGAMCFYVMHVTGQKIDKLNDAVVELTKVVATLTAKVND